MNIVVDVGLLGLWIDIHPDEHLSPRRRDAMFDHAYTGRIEEAHDRTQRVFPRGLAGRARIDFVNDLVFDFCHSIPQRNAPALSVYISDKPMPLRQLTGVNLVKPNGKDTRLVESLLLHGVSIAPTLPLSGPKQGRDARLAEARLRLAALRTKFSVYLAHWNCFTYVEQVQTMS